MSKRKKRKNRIFVVFSCSDWKFDHRLFRSCCCCCNVRITAISHTRHQCVYFLFFFDVCTSTGTVKFCAFCEILFTKYRANIENSKLKISKKSLEWKAYCYVLDNEVHTKWSRTHDGSFRMQTNSLPKWSKFLGKASPGIPAPAQLIPNSKLPVNGKM